MKAVRVHKYGSPEVLTIEDIPVPEPKAGEAREVTKQVNPRIAIPMHFWWEQAVQEYIQGNERVKTLNSSILKISKPELPQPIRTVVMPWGQR
jgi:hypothetical protein